MYPGKDPEGGPTASVPAYDPSKYPAPQYGATTSAYAPQGGYPQAPYPSAPPQGYPGAGPEPYGRPEGARFHFPGSQAPAAGYNTLPGGYGGPGEWDPEAAANASYSAAFQEFSVRQAFVRKVLAIVFMQLAVTVAASAAFFYVHSLKLYVQTNVWPFWAAWGLSFAIILFLTCSQTARRTYPANIITLIIFTATFAFLVGTVTSFYSAQILVVAFAITASVVAFVFLLATSTSFDFTKQGGFLYIITFAFLAALVIGMFWVSNTFIIIISALGAVLFSAYLLYDIQMLMGGRSLELGPDEFVFASINIYLDIINIFLNILSVLNATSSD